MREVRADVLDPEPLDEQLGELEDARRELGNELADGADARRRRRDDDLELAEHVGEPARQAERLGAVAAVRVQLAAAGLLPGKTTS